MRRKLSPPPCQSRLPFQAQTPRGFQGDLPPAHNISRSWKRRLWAPLLETSARFPLQSQFCDDSRASFALNPSAVLVMWMLCQKSESSREDLAITPLPDLSLCLRHFHNQHSVPRDSAWHVLEAQ